MDLGFFETCEKARTTIMMNGVSIAGKLENKPGTQINLSKFYQEQEINPDYIQVNQKLLEYVSRGAYKLKAAQEYW